MKRISKEKSRVKTHLQETTNLSVVKNSKYETVDHKSSRLVSQEVSDLWRATTPDAVNISDNFSQREFAAALQHLQFAVAALQSLTPSSLG